MYAADFRLPGMLFARSLFCPHAHAKVVSMDTSAAEALPGVKLVMNYFNFPKVFIEPEVYHAGEEVAAVVAVDIDTADKALLLIKVEYEKLPWVGDMIEAQKPGAPMVLKDTKSNMRITTGGFFSELNAAGLWGKRVTQEIRGFGDVEVGFKESDVVVEVKDIRHAMTKGPAAHGLGLTTDYNRSEANKLATFYTDSKGLYADRNKFAAILGTPIGKAHLISPYSSGLWGGVMLGVGNRRERSGPISAWASFTLGKPVWHHYNMHEEEKRSCYKCIQATIKIGFKSDGKMVAWEGYYLDESGNQDGSAEGSCERSTPMLAYNRHARHCKLTAGRVASNRLIVGDYVGYGTLHGQFCAEVAMDYAAEALKMDPVELRKINCMQKGGFDAHWNTALAQCSAEGHRECLDAVSATTNWKTKWGGWDSIKSKTGAIRHGIGVAIKTHTGGGWAGTAMLCKMFPDGTFELVTSLGDSGQNRPQGELMAAAEVLGLPYERGTIMRGSTSHPYSIMLGGSTGTWNHGFCTWEAAMNVRKQVLGLGAELFTPVPTDLNLLDMDEGGVFLKSDPAKKQTYTNVFARLANRVDAGGMGNFENRAGSFEVAGYAYRRAPDGLTIPREKGAAIWELDVDTETGEITNLQCSTSDNMGRAVNPPVIENQQTQGAHHGGPWALWTDKTWDPTTGRDLTYNWIYEYPATHMDVAVKWHIVEIFGDKSNPWGATAASEGQPNPHGAAISNAIYNAAGIRMKQSPFTPWKILEALGKV
jgi:xanthine dehydrogenase molybdenum-binding subunit